MILSKRAMSFALLFVVSAVLITAGCAQQEARENTGNPAAHSTGDTLPVQPVSQPAVKNAVAADSRGNGAQEPKPQLGVPPAEAGTPAKGKKVAYLTFDDGPNSDYTEKILDVLRQKKVKASFMVVGKNAKLNPRILQRTIADGHAVVNHTYSHDYTAIYQSADSFIADLDENNRVLAQYTGRPVMLFRAPGGPDKLIRDFTSKLQSRGYTSVGWNISAVDSDPNGVSSEQVYNNIVSGLERVERLRLSPIILMHDGTQLATTAARPGSPLAIYIQNREATLGALPAIIDHFKAKGYTFAVVDQNTPPAW